MKLIHPNFNFQDRKRKTVWKEIKNKRMKNKTFTQFS